MTASPSPAPYRDSVQFDLECKHSFTPSDWEWMPPVVRGSLRLYRGFLPDPRVLATETLRFTFCSLLGTQQITAEVTGADDLVLAAAYADSESLLLNYLPEDRLAKAEYAGETGIERGLIRRVIDRIDWSKVQRGFDLNLSLSVKRSALGRIQPPEGYALSHLVQVEVTGRVAFLGQKVPAWAPDWLKADEVGRP